MEKVLSLFIKLVSIDSPSGEEQQISKFLKSWLDKHNFKYREDALGSILATPTNLKSPNLLLCAHMDTVEPGRGIKVKIGNDGYIRSNGDTILGADNKASIAAILTAVENFQQEYGFSPPIELLFTVKEETGGGIEFFPFKWIKSKKGIIFDHSSPLGKVIISSPYIYNFKVKFVGKSAHASRPEDGINSLTPAINFIAKTPQGKFDDGKTTINIGIVHCGKGINIIPEETIVWGEVRSIVKEKFDYYLDTIKKLAHKEAIINKTKCDFLLDGYCAGYEYSPKDKIIVDIKNIYALLGIELKSERSTGISDANPLVESGIQVVNLSEGVEEPHTTSERISIENLKNLTKIIKTMIFELSK